MRRRLTLFSTVFATAIMMFAAQSLEYRGLEYMTWAGALAIAAIVGTACFAVLAARMFRHVSALEIVLVTCSLAVLPFLIEWLLRLNGTQLNVHGFAILGFFVYGLGSELLAIALIIAVVVRALMHLKRRKATDTGGIPA